MALGSLAVFKRIYKCARVSLQWGFAPSRDRTRAAITRLAGYEAELSPFLSSYRGQSPLPEIPHQLFRHWYSWGLVSAQRSWAKATWQDPGGSQARDPALKTRLEHGALVVPSRSRRPCPDAHVYGCVAVCKECCDIIPGVHHLGELRARGPRRWSKSSRAGELDDSAIDKGLVVGPTRICLIAKQDFIDLTAFPYFVLHH